ncbi:MAG TPA: ABC transporter permease [Xanthomonadaceae bacterium]|nr:ABC transporter permease [Xanthomonadaceae bacterium]
MLANLLADIRYSLRGFAARPLFVLAAVLTLALGIGANTTIFSVLHGMYLRPLPYPGGERLVEVYNTYPNMGLENAGTSIPDFLDRRDHADSLADIALYTGMSFALSEAGSPPERLVGLRATPSLFTTLQVGAALGRVFTDEEAVSGQDRVVVLSWNLWRHRYHGDPGILGRDIRLDGEPHRVIGIMPEGFAFPGRQLQLWVPFAFTPEQMSDMERGNEYSRSVGRLKPGATVSGLNSEMDTIVARNAERLAGLGDAQARGFADFLRANSFTGRAQSLREQQVGDARPMIAILQAAVAMVLLIACANVANLTLTRLNARRKELSLRSALGASRGRIARQILAEAGLLAAIGGAVGVGVAWLAMDLMPALGIRSSSPDYDFRLDASVLAFALGATALAGALSALLPLLSLLRFDANESIKEGGRLGGGGRRAAASRHVLVVTQIALATTLLIGAGLLLRSFHSLSQESPGFASAGLLTVRIDLAPARYGDDGARRRFFDEVLPRLQAIPGIESAAFTSNLPFSGSNSQSSYQIDGREQAAGEPSPHGMQRQVSPDYFRAMGIPLLQGRLIEARDRDGGERVVVIDEILARKYFGEGGALGQRLKLGGGEEWATVIGVVGAVKHHRLAENVVKETLYWPLAQSAPGFGSFVLRSPLPPDRLITQVRDAILAVDPEQPVYDMRTLDDRIALSLDGRRAPMLLVGVFAMVAMLLAAIGIYGVLAFAVGQRTGELGVRMAIGAGARQILRMILRQGARLTAIGLGIGLVGAVVAAHAASAQLFGIAPADPATFLAVIVFLGAVALFACYLPARRAARIDPLAALRHE